VAAVIVVVADLALTGLLHLDGLADSADGLLPHLTRERRLAVMAEPTIGAFGTGVVALVLLARWAVFATVRPTAWSILLVGALWCTSRTSMAATVERLPYARPDDGPDAGLAAAFLGSRLPAWAAGAAVGVAVAAASLWELPAGPVSVAATLVGFGAVLALADRRLGGFTGDVLGAAGMVGETVGLVVAAARW
jgi:adenosylcobinamide-GDP ribazoletransferase